MNTIRKPISGSNGNPSGRCFSNGTDSLNLTLTDWFIYWFSRGIGTEGTKPTSNDSCT
jgi:hypothetical protein